MMAMPTKVQSLVAVLSLLACISLLPAGASAQTSNVAPRITQAVDETNLVTISGSVHPLAQAKYDRGPAADSQPIRRGMVLLQRSPAQEATLRQLMDAQQSSSSPSYHKWLTPAQFGEQFGAASADIQTVSSWLTSHGLTVNRVSTGGTIIEFTGTAGGVQSAFHTSIHVYEVNGEQHFANSTPVKIPAALAPVVAGVVSLHNFPKHPQSRVLGVFSKSKATGQVKPVVRFGPASPGHFPTPSSDFTFAFNGCSVINNVSVSDTCFALGPADFNTIYSVPGSATGANQSIAIVGDSEICTASSPDFNTSFIGPFGTTVTCNSDDVATFRSLFGLPAKSPNVILDGPDPGFNSDETEGDLDVQWSGAIAPQATINFVIAETSEASAGIDLAAVYIVNNNVSPVMSESFGSCEAAVVNQFYSELWEQAAAQGMTVVISAGDSGSANCDDENTEATASFGLNVSGIASTPFNVAVGGTDFNYTAAGYPSNFWNMANGAGQVSAKGPIPETTWNDSCAQSISTVACDTLSASANPLSSSLNIVSGGGGQSNCLNFDDQNNSGAIVCQTPTFASSTVLGYPKPSWQPIATANALTMVTDVTRDVPDVSLFASDGLVSGSFYIVCEQDLDANDAPCSLGTQEPFSTFIGVGGTSSSAPTFAAIMALVNQKLDPAGTNPGLGNADYVLYHLAVGHPNSFNDVTVGNNSVPCGGTGFFVNCNVNSGVGFLVNGGTPAWNAGTGYDLASGLGSVNVANLLTNWAADAVTFTPTATTLCMSTTSTNSLSCAGPITGITHGAKVFVNVAVTPSPGTGTSTFQQAEDVGLIGTFATGTPGCSVPGCTTSGVDRFAVNLTTGLPVNNDVYPLSSGSLMSSTQFLPGGTYTVVAHYPGDGTFGASESNPPITVTISAENSTAAVTVGAVNLAAQTVSTLSSSPATVPYGVLNLIRVDVTGKSGQETATGNVTVTDSFAGGLVGPTGSPAGIFTLNSEGYLEDQTAFLGVGSHKFAAMYTGTSGSGDGSYNASSNSSNVSLSVTQCNTASRILTAPIVVPAGTPVTIVGAVTSFTNANVFGGSVGANITGTLTFTGTTGVATVRPIGTPSSPGWPVWLAALGMSLVLLALLVLFPARRRWGLAFGTLLLVGIIGTSVSCGGGSGGGGGGGTPLNMSMGPTATFDQEDGVDFVAGIASITFTPHNSGTVTVSYSSDTNYAKSTATQSVQITVQ
jgi:Pro-kumamolisin, activation domain